jgi:hypothetical protein
MLGPDLLKLCIDWLRDGIRFGALFKLTVTKPRPLGPVAE